MKVLSRINSITLRRPLTVILVLGLLTGAAGLSLAINGVEQLFTVDQFQPDSDVKEADIIVNNDFAVSYLVGLLTEYHWSPNDPETETLEGNLRKDQFITVLEFERSLAEHEKLKDILVAPVMPGISIISPVNLITIAMFYELAIPFPDTWQSLNLDLEPVLDPVTGEPVLDAEGNVTMSPPITWDNLIRFMDSETGLTFIIHQALNGLLTNVVIPEEYRENLLRLFSDDLQYLVTPVNASASLTQIRIDRSLVTEEFSTLDIEMLLSEMAKAAGTDSVSFSVLGSRLIDRDIEEAAVKDLSTLFPLAAIVIIVMLWAVLREPGQVFVSVSGILAAIIWVYGIGAAMGMVFSPLSLAVPFLVLGVGMDFAIHMILGYRQERQGYDDHAISMHRMLRTVGAAILLATVTTCIAYLSNLFSDMEGIIQFGILNALGIFSAFIVMIFLIPSYLTIKQGDSVNDFMKRESVLLKNMLSSLDEFLRSRGTVIVAVVLILSGGMAVAAANVAINFDVQEFIPQGSDSERATLYVNDNFQSTGLTRVHVLVDGEFTDPVLMLAMQEYLDSMDDNHFIVQTGGLNRIESVFSVMRTWGNQSLTGDPRYDPLFAALYIEHFDPEYGRYAGGANASYLEELLETIMLNPEMSMEFVRYYNSSTGLWRVSIEVYDYLEEECIIEMTSLLRESMDILEEEGYGTMITGRQLKVVEIVDAIREAQLISLMATLAMALVIVCSITLIMDRGAALGGLALLPSALTIVWIWGALYLLDISLNPITMTVGALTVGLGVDYGIHITSRFANEVSIKGIRDATSLAIRDTGRGVMGGALTTALSFGVLGFFSIRPIAEFGVMMMFSVIGAMVISLLILPPLLGYWAKCRGFNG